MYCLFPQEELNSPLSRWLSECEQNTIQDLYLVQRMDECLDLLAKATIFSMLVYNIGYSKVETAKKDCHSTVFTSHHGLFGFTGMLHGLKNDLGMLQRAMDVLLTKNKGPFAPFYLDEIVIFLPTPHEHVVHPRQVLKLLHDAV